MRAQHQHDTHVRVVIQPVRPAFAAEQLARARFGSLPQRDVTWFAASGLRPRSVTGEVVRDESGAWFERRDGALQPLHRPIAGARGELLDLVPITDCAIEVAPRAAAAPASSPHTPPTQPRADSIRLLLPPPGRRRTVTFGDVRALIQSQLADARRLRPSHRLHCHVQICEATAPQRLHALRSAFRAAAGTDAPLVPLDSALADVLHVPAHLRTCAAPAALWREPDVVLPGERFICLQLIDDPTAVVTNDADRDQQARVRRRLTRQAREPHEPAQDAPRSEIPAQYMQPWELQLSREEAIYDMHASRARGFLRLLAASLRARIGRRARLRKWRALLHGRTPDEQLWSVRLPARGYEDPDIVSWAHQALSCAGFDAQQWLPEWELYWRRKGV